MPSSAAIEFSGVQKWFGTNHVLADIDLAIATGEVVVVIGPSGSGKSTLIRCINGLEAVQQGTVVVDGKRLTAKGGELAAIRREVGMVFQAFHLYPHKTVLENVMLAPVTVKHTPREPAESAARALLERVGLPEKADAYPAELSGGQQQRVAIARALVQNPAAILADEPIASLDPELGEQIVRLLCDLARERSIALLCSLHQTELAHRHFDRVIELVGGRIR